MDCFAKNIANNQLFSVIYEPNSFIKLQIETSNAVYQTNIHTHSIPRFFSSIHINTLDQVYQKLKHSIKEGLDLLCYLDKEKQQIGLKITVKLLSTGDIIQKKVLLQTTKFLKAKNNTELELTLKNIVKQQLAQLKYFQTKEKGEVVEKVDVIDFEIRVLQEQMIKLKKMMEDLSVKNFAAQNAQ